MQQIKREKTDVLSVSLPKSLRKLVTRYAQERDLTVSQVTKEALKSYVILSEWRKLQKAFAPAFEKLGIKTDDDVEKYFV